MAFARHVGVPTQRINEIVRGKRGVTPDTAWLFSQAFGTTPEFWLNLQGAYDLARARPSRTVERILRWHNSNNLSWAQFREIISSTHYTTEISLQKGG